MNAHSKKYFKILLRHIYYSYTEKLFMGKSIYLTKLTLARPLKGLG